MAYTTVIDTVRHAQTTYGAEKRYAGTIDVPLSRLGREDTRGASKRIKGADYDVVITSTLRRSIETARLLLGGKVELVKNPLCNERNYGIFEGMRYSDVKKVKPKVLFIRVGNDTHSVNQPGSEPFEEVRKRAEKFKGFLFNNYKGKKVLVVSHFAFLQQFHGLLKGLSCIESLAEEVRNLQLTRFVFKGTRLVETGVQVLSTRKQENF